MVDIANYAPNTKIKKHITGEPASSSFQQKEG